MYFTVVHNLYTSILLNACQKVALEYTHTHMIVEQFALSIEWTEEFFVRSVCIHAINTPKLTIDIVDGRRYVESSLMIQKYVASSPNG